jgi:hypothetical protein
MEFRFRRGTVELVRDHGQLYLAGPLCSLRALGLMRVFEPQDLRFALGKLRAEVAR